MGLFDKIKGPVFLKENSEAERQLAVLQELRQQATAELADQLDEEIRRVDAGIFGEKAVQYELANSHIPMLVLHDLYLEHEGLTAQIDYLIITRKHQFVVECKNLYGNIEINSAGDFIRTVSFGKRTKKEGIYSPITQNRRHLELIKQMRGALRSNFLTKAIFENTFYDSYRSVVVLANPKTVLYDRYAKKEVRKQVIKADQLAEYIRKIDADPKAEVTAEKYMEELAQFFLQRHKEPQIDYAEKFSEAVKAQSPAGTPPHCENKTEDTVKKEPAALQCPKCGAPMIKRKATKGPNAGNEFYGCSNYPQCRCIINIQ